MKDLFKACIFSAGLILMLSLGTAAAYEFGSKVTSGDADEGKILESFQTAALTPTPTIAFLSLGSNPGQFDENSAVYINFAGDLKVNVGDLRLTNYSDLYAAGTKVKGGDQDLGAGPLRSFANPAGQIYFAPGISATGYVLGDSVYLKTTPLPLETGPSDVRLSSPEYAAGTRIRNNDHDGNTPLVLMTSATAGVVNLGLGPVAELRFYNKDGDVNSLGAPIYGSEDPIYLDVSFPGFANYGIVSPNDVRLSA